MYWNKKTGHFRVGKYFYEPISESTDRISPARDPITGRKVDKAASVRIRWENDNRSTNEELVARVHVHPNTHYRAALYPSWSDIGLIDLVRRNASYSGLHYGVDNKKWPHAYEFILFPPGKHYDPAEKSNIKQVDKISMLMHYTPWRISESKDWWDTWEESRGTNVMVMDKLDQFVFRFNDDGTIVDGGIAIENQNLNDKINNLCD